MILDSGFCTRCGHALKEDDLYCPECGAPQFTVEVQDEPNPQNLLAILIAVGIVAAAAAFVISSLSNFVMAFLIIPFFFVTGRKRTLRGTIVNGILLGFMIGITASLVCKACNVVLF